MDVGFLTGIQLRNASLLIWPLLRTRQLLAPSRRYIAYGRRSAAGALATAAGDPSAVWLPGKLPSQSPGGSRSTRVQRQSQRRSAADTTLACRQRLSASPADKRRPPRHPPATTT